MEPLPEVFDSIVGLLNRKDYDFRTVESIARELQLSSTEVRAVVDKYPYYVRKCPITDLDGNALYTSADKPVRLREILACIQVGLSRDFERYAL